MKILCGKTRFILFLLHKRFFMASGLIKLFFQPREQKQTVNRIIILLLLLCQLIHLCYKCYNIFLIVIFGVFSIFFSVTLKPSEQILSKGLIKSNVLKKLQIIFPYECFVQVPFVQKKMNFFCNRTVVLEFLNCHIYKKEFCTFYKSFN